MNKSLLKYALGIIIGVFIGQNTSARNIQPKSLSAILAELYNPASGYVMISAHRGENHTHPENSIQGLQKCISLGIDIVELDVKETKDGHIIVLHDDTLGRSTTGFGRVAELTLTDIKRESLRMRDGTVVSQKVPTLEEYLSIAKGKILMQIDKWMPVKDKVLHILEEKGCLGQCIFRGTYSSAKVKSLFGDYLDKIIYIPVVNTDRKKAMELLDDYKSNLKTPVISFIFTQEEPYFFNEILQMKKKYRIWFNAIQQDISCAGHGDNLADKSLPDSYGWLVKKGSNIIFSDKALLLDSYLHKNKLR